LAFFGLFADVFASGHVDEGNTERAHLISQVGMVGDHHHHGGGQFLSGHGEKGVDTVTDKGSHRMI
jgi:hypothetical protein